jgi:hypothetical protein
MTREPERDEGLPAFGTHPPMEQSLCCARCRTLMPTALLQVKIGRFIYCLYCGDEKVKAAAMSQEPFSSIFIKPKEEKASDE